MRWLKRLWFDGVLRVWNFQLWPVQAGRSHTKQQEDRLRQEMQDLGREWDRWGRLSGEGAKQVMQDLSKALARLRGPDLLRAGDELLRESEFKTNAPPAAKTPAPVPSKADSRCSRGGHRASYSDYEDVDGHATMVFRNADEIQQVARGVPYEQVQARDGRCNARRRPGARYCHVCGQAH